MTPPTESWSFGQNRGPASLTRPIRRWRRLPMLLCLTKDRHRQPAAGRSANNVGPWAANSDWPSRSSCWLALWMTARRFGNRRIFQSSPARGLDSAGTGGRRAHRGRHRHFVGGWRTLGKCCRRGHETCGEPALRVTRRLAVGVIGGLINRHCARSVASIRSCHLRNTHGLPRRASARVCRWPVDHARCPESFRRFALSTWAGISARSGHSRCCRRLPSLAAHFVPAGISLREAIPRPPDSLASVELEYGSPRLVLVAASRHSRA